jgi:hypothetical protein
MDGYVKAVMEADQSLEGFDIDDPVLDEWAAEVREMTEARRKLVAMIADETAKFLAPDIEIGV